MKNTPLRVGIVGISHESNTFVPVPTTLDHFRGTMFLKGEKIREHYSNAHQEIGGFLQALAENGVEAVPLFYANTPPWGPVSDDALAALWHEIENELAQCGRLDGVLAAPHGAAVSVSQPDMDGWWLGQLRNKLGPDVPIIATADPHANLSPAMIAACDGIITYRENPHLDQRQRGLEAGHLMARTLRGEVRPVTAAAFPRIAINIERQLTSTEPMLSIRAELEKTRARDGVLSASLVMGFPYADIPDMGSAFIVIADGRPDLAREEADRLAAWLIQHRQLFRGQMISPEEAVARAATSPGPVGLLDMGDNSGGGAPGDSTVLARLLGENKNLKTLFFLPDPESVRACQEVGVGGRLSLQVGGKLPMTPAPPLEVDVTVTSFHSGKFTETEARHGGRTGGDLGATAVAKTADGMTLMLFSRREGVNASIQPMLTCGLRPQDFDVIVIKGVHAPVGAYAAVCPTLIRVNTPGVTCADMDALPYKNRRRPLFPFEG